MKCQSLFMKLNRLTPAPAYRILFARGRKRWELDSLIVSLIVVVAQGLFYLALDKAQRKMRGKKAAV